ERLDDARARVAEALAAEPANPAWLDTAAVVAAASGDLAAARAHALRAARLSPDDPYLLWQVDRLSEKMSP
ncbi:MAG: hypothetical protein ACOZNI_05405, partial [Myxococcota bacterium]